MSSVLLDEVEETPNGGCKRFRLNDFSYVATWIYRYLFRDISFRREVYQLTTGDIRFNISQRKVWQTLKLKFRPTHPTPNRPNPFFPDDKIELNLQMNQTLEAGTSHFQNWFVNFNFPNFDGGWWMLDCQKAGAYRGGEWGKWVKW